MDSLTNAFRALVSKGSNLCYQFISASTYVQIACNFDEFSFGYNAKRKRKKKKTTQKTLLSRVESVSCIHLKEIQEILWERGMEQQLIIRIGFYFGHEICAIITLSKSMKNNDIVLLNQIFHILNQDNIDMELRCLTFQEVDTVQRVGVANELDYV